MAFDRMVLTALAKGAASPTATNLTSIISSLVSAFSQDIPGFLRYMVADVGKPAGLRNQFYR
jgi:hypothetical protein